MSQPCGTSNMENNFVIITIVLAVFNGVYSSVVTRNEECFPKNFAFGVATAAYQIEGAWNVSGKGENIWDRYTHEYPDRIFDHTNADVGADSYHLFREDIRLMKNLGVNFYRFSISWSRILPTGLSNEVNEDGLRYYDELLDELHRNNILPLVTMYHWDLPQSLQDLGGWTNPLMADYFVDYARVLLESFNDKVPSWTTFNEPLSFCHSGYGGMDAPGSNSSGFEDYMCAHNVLRAHGMVYRMFKKEFVKGKGNTMGLTLNMAWQEPASTSPADQRAAETARQFLFGWFAHPIFSKKGDYPPIMRYRINEVSRRQHFPRSRLPTFTAEEVEYIRGSADFLGINHYTTVLVSSGRQKITPQPSFEVDVGVTTIQKDDWPKSNSTWLRVVPWGFRKMLNWVKRTYNNPLVVITENGLSTGPGLRDRKRVMYLDAYLRAFLGALADGCNVVGYTYWSLLDNFEWTRGFSERFGLHEVDYSSPKKTRTPRASAAYYKQLIKTRCLPPTYWDELDEEIRL